MSAAPSDQQTTGPQEVFISYSRKDTDFVHRVDDALKSRGREAWVDWADIRPAEEWMSAIYAAIEGANTFVLVLTPDSVASPVCGREIAHAAAHNKRMVPIVAREVNADTVPEALAKLNFIFFYREGDDFEKRTNELISALDTDLTWVRMHTRLLTRAIEWETNGKNNSFALRGEDLQSAERWLAEAGAQKERQPTKLQIEYVIASRKAAAKRQRITLGAITFGFVVAIVLAVVSFFAEAKAKAQTKKTSELASRDNVSLARYAEENGKKAQALAHLAQALRLNPENREAADLTAAMLTQIGWHLPLTASMRHDAAVTSAQFSPDGQRVVTASADKTARLWDLPAVTKKDTKEDILLLSALSETMGGVTLESAERAENFTTLRSEPIGAIREKIAAKLTGVPFELSPLQRFLKWCVADRRSRTISPFSQETVSEWLQNRINEGTVEANRLAGRFLECSRDRAPWSTSCRSSAQARRRSRRSPARSRRG
jgi:hypothetical protein